MAMDAPRFDKVVRAQIDGVQVDVVVHLDSGGKLTYWHSPLTRGVVGCEICETAARVYLDE